MAARAAKPIAKPKEFTATPGTDETVGPKRQQTINQATFADNPTTLLVLQQLQEMYQQGFFGDNALADTFADTGKHLAAGDYAMAITMA